MAIRWRELPKAERHLHFEGAAFCSETIPASLEEYFGMYSTLRYRLETWPAMATALRRVVSQAVDEGVVFLELGFRPTHQSLGTPSEVLSRFLEMCRDEERSSGVVIRLQFTLNRRSSPSSLREDAELAVKFAHKGVFSLGLAGPEDAGLPTGIDHAVAIGREGGLPFHPHAGELDRSSIDEILFLRPDRILHGIASARHADLLALIVGKRIPLDVCPISSCQLSIGRSAVEEALQELDRSGARFSLNTDSSGLLQTDLHEQFKLYLQSPAATFERVAQRAKDSLVGAPVDRSTHQLWLNRIDSWLDRSNGSTTREDDA